MSNWEKPNFEVWFNDNKYHFTNLDIDISESWRKKFGDVIVECKIESAALPTTIYMITDLEEGSFGFGHKVIEDGEDHGLFVTLQDEKLNDELTDLVCSIE